MALLFCTIIPEITFFKKIKRGIENDICRNIHVLDLASYFPVACCIFLFSRCFDDWVVSFKVI